MITEGLFTQDEINAARLHGAEVEQIWQRTILTFNNNKAYEQWACEQTKLHPERWSDSIRISAKNR